MSQLNAHEMKLECRMVSLVPLPTSLIHCNVEILCRMSLQVKIYSETQWKKQFEIDEFSRTFSWELMQMKLRF